MQQKYRIGTAARLAGVCVETLRTYVDRGLVRCERIDDQRIFDESAIEQARQVKERNMSRLRRGESLAT